MSDLSAGRPVVGVLACQKTRSNGSTYSRVNDVLAARLADMSGSACVLLPAASPDTAATLAHRIDGLVMPGSGSCVHPSRYSPRPEPIPGREYDNGRDEAALALLDAAAAVPDLPILGSCRGMHEIAVHSGGAVRDTCTSSIEHRLSEAGGDRWAPAHSIELRPGGVLTRLAGPSAGSDIAVNSQHTQVVDRLPEFVRVEATAPDGEIEALSIDWPNRFVLGIQWHFEHRPMDTSLNQEVLRAFGRRCAARMEGRTPCVR